MLANRLRISSFIVAFGLLILIDLAARLGRPLEPVRLVQAVDNGYVTKFETWDNLSLRDRFEKLRRLPAPDAVVLGASTANALVVTADFIDDHNIAYYGDPAARRLSLDLSRLMHHSVRVANLSARGSMLSADLAVFQELLAGGTKPKMVILAVGVRDLVDNFPAGFVYDQYLKRVKFQRELFTTPSLQRVCTEEFFKTCDHLYGTRDDYQFIVARLFHQVVDAVSGKKNTEFVFYQPHPGLDPRFDGHLSTADRNIVLADYAPRYSPPNFQQLEAQGNRLRQIAARCQSEGIRLVVVRLPMSQSHRKLVPEVLLQASQRELASDCSEYNAQFIDLLARGDFDEGDFKDTVHLCSQGAVKSTNAICAAMSVDSNSCRALGGATGAGLASSQGQPLQ